MYQYNCKPLTDVTVDAEDGNVSLFGTLVSDMQDDVTVANGKITGTLKYLSEGAIPERWGEGYFIALKFSDIDNKATSVKVGLQPSVSSGLVEIIDDPDKNGVFKVTDKNAQKFIVISSADGYYNKQKFELADLTLEETQG